MKRHAAPNRVNRKRRTAAFAKAYGSRERVEFVKALRCSACGVAGASQNAHVLPGGGMSLKAPYTHIAPLCGPHWTTIGGVTAFVTGCHHIYDCQPGTFAYRFPAYSAEESAAATERAWQQFHDSVDW